jgi:hypothetical protein
LLVDDGTARAEVIFDDPNAYAGLEAGRLVRVVARVLPLIDGHELRGECVQLLDGFDMELWKKVRTVMNKKLDGAK